MLTPTEHKLAALLLARKSDRAVCAQLGLDHGTVVTMTAGLRTKLACGPAETLRDAIRRVGL